MLAAQGAPGIGRHNAQELKFRTGERQYLTMACHLHPSQIENEGPEVDDVATGPAAIAVHHGLPAQDRMQPCNQLARVERFRQIVVSAHFKAQDPVHRRPACGQHQDGNGASLRAQATANRQAVLARHHQVQDQYVEGFTP